MHRFLGFLRPRGRREVCCLWAFCGVLLLVLIGFAETGYWAGDEGYHLVAAKLINAGKRPYVDFFYQQVPLFPYVTAAWMRLFGESWQSAHFLSALLMGASVFLAAGFVFRRLPDPRWRLSAACVAGLLAALRHMTYSLGTTSQPYALCQCLTTAAFCLAVGAVDKARAWRAAGAGLCAGAAAASTLLTAPAGPVLFGWLLWHNQAGSRWAKALAFLGAGVLPFLPLAWLAWQGPRQTFFDVVEFHLFHRDIGRGYTFWHDVDSVLDWFGSPQGLFVSLLAGVGVLFLAGKCDWERKRRAEFFLAAWLVAGLGAYLSCTRPTFTQYFFVLTPFLSILAAVGCYAVGSRVWAPRRPAWAVVLVAGYYAVTPASSLCHYLEADQAVWQEYEAIVREADRVTPAGGLLFSRDEVFYFPGLRLPPPGLENLFTHYLDLPPALSSTLHIIPPRELDRRLTTGYYSTLIIEAGHPWLRKLKLLRRYGGRKELHGYYVLWHFRGRRR
jgi:hypothetical protein